VCINIPAPKEKECPKQVKCPPSMCETKGEWVLLAEKIGYRADRWLGGTATLATGSFSTFKFEHISGFVTCMDDSRVSADCRKSHPWQACGCLPGRSSVKWDLELIKEDHNSQKSKIIESTSSWDHPKNCGFLGEKSDSDIVCYRPNTMINAGDKFIMGNWESLNDKNRDNGPHVHYVKLWALRTPENWVLLLKDFEYAADRMVSPQYPKAAGTFSSFKFVHVSGYVTCMDDSRVSGSNRANCPWQACGCMEGGNKGRWDLELIKKDPNDGQTKIIESKSPSVHPDGCYMTSSSMKSDIICDRPNTKINSDDQLTMTNWESLNDVHKDNGSHKHKVTVWGLIPSK